MAGQSVDRHHPDPVVDGVGCAVQWSSFHQPAAKRADLTQCPRAAESDELRIIDLPLIPPDLVQPASDLAYRRWLQSGPAEQDAQGVDVVADRLAAHESRLNGSGPPPHKRIVDDVAGRSETLDKELRKLRLEASPVAHLVDRMGLTLTCGPEFVDQVADGAFPHLGRRLTELIEILDQIDKRRPRSVANGFWNGGNRIEQWKRIPSRIRH